MKHLLDTHVLHWWLSDEERLGRAARQAIEAPENLCSVSVASIWEIAVKTTLGKLDVPADIEELLGREGFASPAFPRSTRGKCAGPYRNAF